MLNRKSISFNKHKIETCIKALHFHFKVAEADGNFLAVVAWWQVSPLTHGKRTPVGYLMASICFFTGLLPTSLKSYTATPCSGK